MCTKLLNDVRIFQMVARLMDSAHVFKVANQRFKPHGISFVERSTIISNLLQELWLKSQAVNIFLYLHFLWHTFSLTKGWSMVEPPPQKNEGGASG